MTAAAVETKLPASAEWMRPGRVVAALFAVLSLASFLLPDGVLPAWTR